MKFFKKILFLFLVIPNIVFANFTWDPAVVAGPVNGRHPDRWIDGNVILNTERLYRALRVLPIANVIATINTILTTQGNWGNQRNRLAIHLVQKGHFGFTPISSSPEPRGEDRGFVKAHRIDTNEPRSFFYPSAELQQRIMNYRVTLVNRLNDLHLTNGMMHLLRPAEAQTPNPVPPPPHLKNDQEIFVLYKNIENQMSAEAGLLIDAFRNNWYIAHQIDFDEKNDTIRIKAVRDATNHAVPAVTSPAAIVGHVVPAVPGHPQAANVPADWDMRNGKQPNLNFTAYNDTNGDVFIYVQIGDNNRLLINSIFPGSNWETLNTREDIRTHGNAPIDYKQNVVINP